MSESLSFGNGKKFLHIVLLMFQGRIGEPGMIGEKGVPGIAGPRVSFLLFLTLHVYAPMVLKQLILMFRDAEHNHAV